LKMLALVLSCLLILSGASSSSAWSDVVSRGAPDSSPGGDDDEPFAIVRLPHPGPAQGDDDQPHALAVNSDESRCTAFSQFVPARTGRSAEPHSTLNRENQLALCGNIASIGQRYLAAFTQWLNLLDPALATRCARVAQ